MDTDRKRQDSYSKLGRDEEIFFPNDILIKELWIQVGPLQRIDVKRLLVGLDIFEDMYSNVLTGSLTLVDAVNLIGNYPFVGQEQIEIVFKTPGFPQQPETRMLFEVYGISSRNVGNAGDITDTTQTYTLNFVSPVYFRNQQSRVLKAFTNEPISEMVGQIAGNILGENVTLETTSGIQSYVIPRWTPFRAINWLAARARPETNPHAANYFFFETLLDGFYFRSVNQMVQSNPAVRFVYNVANERISATSSDRPGAPGRERALTPEVQMIRNYSVLESGTMLERIEQGMYSSKLITHDIVKKEFDVHEFTYKKNFDRLKHTESALSDTNDGVQEQQDPMPFYGDLQHGEEFDSVAKFYPKHTQLYDGIPNPDESEKWVQQRMSQLRQLEAQRVRVQTAGLNFLQVGQTVILEVPRPEPLKGTDPPEDADANISGKYLITSIHHMMRLDNHEMVLELSKESLRPDSYPSWRDIADATSTSKRFNVPADGVLTGIDLPTIGIA